MLERQIEKRLIDVVRASGGECWKWPAGGGAPDRLVFLPGGQLILVECKAPGKKPRPLQAHVHERLRKLGFQVVVLDRLICSINDLVVYSGDD